MPEINILEVNSNICFIVSIYLNVLEARLRKRNKNFVSSYFVPKSLFS